MFSAIKCALRLNRGRSFDNDWGRTTAYWKGRGEGWFACENMVLERIKQRYPQEQADKLIEELLQ